MGKLNTVSTISLLQSVHTVIVFHKIPKILMSTLQFGKKTDLFFMVLVLHFGKCELLILLRHY